MKVYKNDKKKELIMSSYDELVAQWGVETVEVDVETYAGSTHVIECGADDKPPLVLLHGVGDDSALMWIYNAKALSEHFRLYAIDTIGGPGKSVPSDGYNKEFDQAVWLRETLDNLGLHRVFLAGVSNGAYMTQYFAMKCPEYVERFVSISGGVPVQTGGNPMLNMMKVFLPEALFPTDKNIAKLLAKMAGKNSAAFTQNRYVFNHFKHLMKGFNNMSMGMHKVRYFTDEEISSLKDRGLYLLGEADPMGNVSLAKENLKKYGLKSMFFADVGHGLNHEIAEECNQILIDYFA